MHTHLTFKDTTTHRSGNSITNIVPLLILRLTVGMGSSWLDNVIRSIFVFLVTISVSEFWKKSSHFKITPSTMSNSFKNFSSLHSVSASSDEMTTTPLLSISTTTIPAVIAFVVAIAGIMFPAIDFTSNRDLRAISKI
ncbi:hypothetical protein GQX74_004748 [Glossina fuscipes]|nr:hypothetical protein GQX74_004748 [Glossina fuscipes]